MSHPDPLLEASLKTFEAVRLRWASLNLPLWLLADNGTSLASLPGEQWKQLLSSPSSRASLDALLRLPLTPSQPRSVHAGNGKWFIRSSGRMASRAGHFVTAIESNTTDSIAPPSSVQQTAQFLHWMIEDVSQKITDVRTIAQFSHKLAQSFEEVSLLFRISELLNTSDEPTELVRKVLLEMKAILPFAWLAVRFDAGELTCLPLRGQSIHVGIMKREQILPSVSTELLAEAKLGCGTLILDPNSDAQAAAMQTELICRPIEHDGKVIAIILAGEKGGDDPAVTSFELQFLDAAAQFLGIFHENISRFSEQHAMFMGTVRSITASIDAKDRYTRGHSERVALLSAQMAAAMGFTSELVERFRIAGLVHDVGKIGIRGAVLCKTGKLTADEFDQIKKHPEIGYNILRDIPQLANVLPGVLHHHEHWSGRGYPHGLSGSGIPLIARIITLADTFDAMSSNRSYRAAMPRSAIINEIRKCAGTQFDPSLVETFLSLDFSAFDAKLSEEAAKQLAA